MVARLLVIVSFLCLLIAEPARADIDGQERLFRVFFVDGAVQPAPAEIERAARSVRQFLAMVTDVRIRVTGHTDRTGSSAENLARSVLRAQYVAVHIESLGIPRDRISVRGAGEDEPFVATADGVPEPLNRRVEVLVQGRLRD